MFLKFANAHIPTHTRDGRQWDSVGGSAPDPFAKLLIDDKEILLTPVQANTLEPDLARSEASATIASRRASPCASSCGIRTRSTIIRFASRSIGNILAEASDEQNLELRCDSGATIEIVVQPAHAKFGLGLYYELGSDDIHVTRVVGESPAGARQAHARRSAAAHSGPRRERHGSRDRAQSDQRQRLDRRDLHGQARRRFASRR